MGTVAAIGIHNMRGMARRTVTFLNNVPMITPDIITGISIFLLFVFLGISRGMFTVICAHIAFCTPYVILNVLPKLRQMDRFTFEAAQDLGCSPKLAFYKVVIPEIMPGMVSGFLMAFTYSLDDFVISYFVSSASSQTLPVTIFSMVRKRVSPEVNALTAIIFVVVLVLLLFSNYYSARKEKQMMRKEGPAV